jgi:DNA-binding transcriptional LysR family regulator
MRLSAEQLSARALGLEIVGHASAISILAGAAAGLGVAYLPDCLTYEHMTSGRQGERFSMRADRNQ